ncbi:uncharacterized protein [Rutidosis leptorrhynchoides]|uniref:uncharacterized protein n=1 Tax=Rutidosis leptorrhynchoides TaxID=125765 RepID=UPI003A99DC7A
MEFDSAKITHDTHVGKTEDSSASVQLEAVTTVDRKHRSAADNKVETRESEDDVCMDSGDVNMEASISAEDVIRAGGYGARDDISSFLPVASDSTDFEASLRDARDYEEPQKDICRPGLGWTDLKDQK